MAEDKFDRLGPMLNAVGAQVASDLGGDPEGIYLYVEVGDRWISVNVFREEEGVVRNYEASHDLTELIWEVWAEESSDPIMRWCVMEYEILGGRFDAQLKYPDEVDVESFDTDRREAALKKRYGDKPVIYPPMSGHFQELKSE